MRKSNFLTKSVITVAGCYILWGLLTIFWKLLAGVDSFYVLATRIFWALIVSAVGVTATKNWPQVKAALKDKKTALKLLVASAFITVNWGCYIWCVMNGHILDSSLAYYINPLLAILLGCLIFGEKLGKAKWVAVGLAVVGVVYPMFVEGQVPYLAIVIGLTFAVYGAVKKSVSVSSTVSLFVETLFISPFALALIIYMELNGTGAVSSGLVSGWRLLLLPAAGFVTYLPLFLFSYGIKDTPMSIAGILMYVNPTIQLIIGVTIYGEALTQSKLVTFAFVWVALTIFLVADRIKSKRLTKIEPKEIMLTKEA